MSFFSACHGTRTQQNSPRVTSRAAAVFVRGDSVALWRRCEAAPLTAAAAGSRRPAGPAVGTLAKQMDSVGFHLKGFYLVCRPRTDLPPLFLQGGGGGASV